MRLSDTAIKRPVFAWMLMAALIIFGGLAYRGMGISMLPDVDSPTVSVQIDLEGAAPEVIETQITDQVESALLSIQGIKNIYSSSRQGSSDVTLEFNLDKDIDLAVQEIQTVLSRIQKKLPKDTLAPTVRKRNPEDRPILWLSVTSDRMPVRELMTYVRDNLRDQFSTIDGVADIFMGGYLEPNLRVWPSIEKLDQYQLTIDDLINTIQKEHQELPAGRIETSTQEKSIRMLGEANTVEEFGNLVINKRGGTPNYRTIYLKDLAKLEEGTEDIRRIARTNGLPAIGIGIMKQRGSNSVEVADRVKKKLTELQSQLPQGMEVGVNFDSTFFIKDAVHELVFTLILSAILTALVCWLFLGSWSATINIILAIPTSIIGSFMVLRALNFTLNTFTLLGLSLAIGIVVDDAIMVLENIVRHYEKGKDRYKAAIFGTREISFAALAATVAIVAIFLPVAFMEGVIGRYFFEFGVTISVAVLLSLLEALTLTPMRCSQFLEVGNRTTAIGRGVDLAFLYIKNFYQRPLRWTLEHRWKTVIFSLLFFILSIGSIKLLRQEMVPSQDQGLLFLRIKTAEGSSIEFTDQKVREIEKVLQKEKSIARYFGSIGGFGSSEVNTAMAFVTMHPFKKREINPKTGKRYSQQAFANALRGKFKDIPDVITYIQDPSASGMGGRRGYPIEFTISGPEWDQLATLSKTVMDEMGKTKMMSDINSDYVSGSPEIQILPNREAAAQFGVSISDIGTTLNALVGGVVAGMYTKGGKRYDIRIRLDQSSRGQIEDLKKLHVRNNRGELIPLDRLITVQEKTGPQTISRLNRARSIGLSANLMEKASQAKALNEIQKIGKRVLPPNYYISMSGSSKEFKEAFAGLFFALLLGIIVSYMVLASQFNSFVDPLTVLMALPFSISGAFLGLLFTGQSLNIYSMIGLILLMGIVKKNSILMVDFTNQMRQKGLSVKEAILEAAPVRLRPILMTTFSTIAAALPPAMSFGPGAESRMPMAVAVIGGVLLSTLLTLFVVPCVYSLLGKRK